MQTRFKVTHWNARTGRGHNTLLTDSLNSAFTQVATLIGRALPEPEYRLGMLLFRHGEYCASIIRVVEPERMRDGHLRNEVAAMMHG